MFTYKVYAGKDCFKTKRIRKNNKVFSLYRSMIGKKLKKLILRYSNILFMFVVIIGLAGAMFKIVFLNMILGMGKHEAPVMEASLPDKVNKTAVERVVPTNEYRIIGIVDDHYIVNNIKELKKVKIDMKKKKNVNDVIKIEKL